MSRRLQSQWDFKGVIRASRCNVILDEAILVRWTVSRIMKTGMGYREITTMEPDKMGGEPCVRGLRIMVYDVLDYLASDMSEAEILADFLT